jgi:predicted MFS family arabinose efflux permease
MALVVTALAPLTLAAREPEVPAAASVARSSPLAVLRALPSALRVPGAAAALAFVGLYKTGESVLDGMFKPFLLRHFDKAQVALWVSTYGTAASVLGSVCGGLLVRALGLYPALATAALLRLLPDVGIWWLTWAGVSEERVVAVTLTEHFFGGLLTPAVFALMMAQVDRRIGGTHFTLLSVVEVLGKTPGGWLSGVAVTALGFEGAFGLGAALSAAVLLLLLPLRRLPAVRGAR